MERNVMGEPSMHGAAGTKPNLGDIARRHGPGRHTVAKYWREGAEAGDRRSERESAFERVRPVVEAKA
ncbi:IS21 family transposase, partial [Collinsella tanakaei]|nr:IS21 family transposase [Collinsella tanakaei]